MAIQHAKPSEVISLPLGAALAGSRTTTLVKTDQLELIRLVVAAGKEIPMHQARGPITVQCLEGQVVFISDGKTQELRAGQMLYLLAGEPHALKGVEDASLLVTLLLPLSEALQPRS